ncbi:hypothetical protein K1719_014210 [Acacia pycnantha]|nr:hypothetical protein K1719_014210 [Acacia pycnantha]
MQTQIARDLKRVLSKLSSDFACLHKAIIPREGRPGLRKAAEYIKGQLEVIKERARPSVRIEIEETTVNGSFTMIFLHYGIALGYRNHTNIIMRNYLS